MRSHIGGARSVALVVLGGVTLVGGLASSAAPASAAVPPATVSSSAATGIQIIGSIAGDKFGLTRAGTSTSPLVHIDAAAPLNVQSGCRPVVGDPTRALCVEPVNSDGSLRTVTVRAGAGDDFVGHGASLPIPMYVTGDSGRDAINGGPAQDSLHGGDDNDSVRAGDGNDSVSGGLGQDKIDGGEGNDYLSGNSFDLVGSPISNADGFVDSIDGNDGKDRCIRSVVDLDSVQNCEAVVNA
jgi:Ca2+-binding RTX toxin-like protein